jgi:hypothetical protein
MAKTLEDMPLVTITDTDVIANGLPDAGVNRTQSKMTSRWDGHSSDTIQSDVLNYQMPEQARILADGAFSELAEMLQREGGLHIEYGKTQGRRLNPSRIVDAYNGADDVWIDYRKKTVQARRVAIVIDGQANVRDPAEKLASRVIFALGLAMALEIGSIDVEILCPYFVHERQGKTEYGQPWIGPFKSYRFEYLVKSYGEPLMLSRFGLLQDTGAKRLMNICIAGSRGFAADSPIYCNSPRWTDIEDLVKDADTVIWIGHHLANSWDAGQRLIQCPVSSMWDIDRQSKELTEKLTDREGWEERQRQQEEEARKRWDAYMAQRAAEEAARVASGEPEPKTEKPAKMPKWKPEKPKGEA